MGAENVRSKIDCPNPLVAMGDMKQSIAMAKIVVQNA